ncbi:MAG TPA: phage holin family protein, partial [Nocardioidaceae bacterium]|nr:phage holin family protein [Nocardioidaceae bacterium]
IACAVLALILVLPAWLSALIVAAVLFVIAGLAALMGRSKVQQATPVQPTRAMDSVKRDVEEVKEHGR